MNKEDISPFDEEWDKGVLKCTKTELIDWLRGALIRIKDIEGRISVEPSLFDGLPENYPLYKDSGLWQMRSDDMEEVWVQQKVNETSNDFLKRCIEWDKWNKGGNFKENNPKNPLSKLSPEGQRIEGAANKALKEIKDSTKEKKRSGNCANCKNTNIDKDEWCFENCDGGSEFKARQRE